MTPLDFGLAVAASFIGSMFAFVIWVHFHLEVHWQDRKDRIERERWAKSEHGQDEMMKHHAAAVEDLVGQ